MLLIIDNYDSFVYNLARYFERLGQTTHVVRNDCIAPDDVQRLAPDAIILSPGPCTPYEAGNSVEIVKQLHRDVPMLGVCLGHQTIAAALGGDVVRAPRPMHGQASGITHDGGGVLDGLPSPFTAGRYHSLIVDEATLPDELAATAWSEDRLVMAISHRTLPIFGVQFHPESILTDHGFVLLANFLRIAGCDVPTRKDLPAGELQQRRAIAAPLPNAPVTF